MAHHFYGLIKPLFVVFCDEIRREMNGKEMLIGVYNGNIVIQTVPITVGVALWIPVQIKSQGETFQRRILVLDPSGNRAGETVIPITPVSIGEEYTTAAVSLPPLAISVMKPGKIQVLWESDSGEMELIGEKEVTVVAYPPPS